MSPRESAPVSPANVEIRRSARRRRTVTAYREDGRTIVLVPARMSQVEVNKCVEELVARIDQSERRAKRGDSELMTRAQHLSKRYLQGAAQPTSVRWVSNQRKRWGSATPVDGTIRLSERLATMPSYVVDAVLLHELAHLVVAGHGLEFHALLVGYPEMAKAHAFLAGVGHADQYGRDQTAMNSDAALEQIGCDPAALDAVDEPPIDLVLFD